MLTLRIIFIVGLSLILFGCTEANKSSETDFQQLAETGKQVFRQNHCSRCHNDSTSQNQFVPDLKRPFLAGNEVLVELHLNNMDISLMPEFKLTKEEINALSVYVSTLHASAYATVSEEEADARCPVCFAPVSTKKAREDSLVYEFAGKEYFFECDACKQLFIKIPDPYSGS